MVNVWKWGSNAYSRGLQLIKVGLASQSSSVASESDGVVIISWELLFRADDAFKCAVMAVVSAAYEAFEVLE